MRSSILPLLFLLVAAPAVHAQADAGKPLPDVKELQARSLAGLDRMKEQREKYLCKVKVINRDTDSKGRVKKTSVAEREVFFVHGHEIAQTMMVDGKPLSADDQHKRDENVRKAIEKAMAPRDAKAQKQPGIRDVLRVAKLTNERRLPVAGRPTIVFDIVPDPDKGGSIFDKFAHAVEGTISIDEQSGMLQDVNVRGTRDVKVGGGLVANVHKGFQFHVVNQAQADGTWFNLIAEGKGDAKVGLFVREAGDFRQETEGCKIYDVSTAHEEKVPEPPK